MKKKLLSAGIAIFALCGTLKAQYSNATLNGPWVSQFQNCNEFIVFDGHGRVTGWEGNSESITDSIGVYEVSGDSITIQYGGSIIQGTLTNHNTFIGILDSSHYCAFRVQNPGELRDSLTGIFYDSTNTTSKNVVLYVNDSGAITGASGLAGATGYVFTANGYVAGYMFTADTAYWNEIGICGNYSSNQLSGLMESWYPSGEDENTGSVNPHCRQIRRVMLKTDII